MELRDSGRTISFFSRIVYQVPTIAVSTLTMIAISRNLGPSGRGEISQILLFAALASSILCTPIFLTVMNLGDSSEIKSYVSRSLYLFSRNNLAIITLFDMYLLLFNRNRNQEFNISLVVYMDFLIVSYFVSAQIRDLLLRFHRNKIYAVDFVVQMLITTPIFVLLLTHTLNVLAVIQAFTFAYGIYSIFLLALLKSRAQEFSYTNLIRRKSFFANHSNVLRVSTSFSRSGLLFQIFLSKDLLFGSVLLPKGVFGLMSALTSFWFALRFLRPSAVVQLKLGRRSGRESGRKSKFLEFISKPTSAIYLQSIAIGLMGFLSYILTPILMGRGFKPEISMSIAGAASEILLMKCLYDLSTAHDKFSENTFILLCLLQIVLLGLLKVTDVKISILVIWSSSCLVYAVWQSINFLKSKS